MLSNSSRLKIKDILSRVAKGELVTLQERVFVNKFVGHNQTVSNWLKRAQRTQQNAYKLDSIEKLINDLDLGDPDPTSHYREEDDLGEWFIGAPPWLGRS
tara:strand:- start:4714 stop:5013 length:300 start_codon:yes stop_codon:yes gene_type:complete